MLITSPESQRLNGEHSQRDGTVTGEANGFQENRKQPIWQDPCIFLGSESQSSHHFSTSGLSCTSDKITMWGGDKEVHAAGRGRKVVRRSYHWRQKG